MREFRLLVDVLSLAMVGGFMELLVTCLFDSLLSTIVLEGLIGLFNGFFASDLLTWS